MSTTTQYPKSQTLHYRMYRIFVDGSEETSTEASPVLKWTDTVTKGDNIPNWRQAMKLGQDCTTSLQVVNRSIKAIPGFMVEWRKTNSQSSPSATHRWLADGFFGLGADWPADPASLVETVANNKALGKFNQKVRSAQTSFEGGVFLGELTKTIHGIRHPAESLRKLVDLYHRRAKALRDAHRRTAALRKYFTKAVADLWLEHAFHWTPLFSDIKSGVNTLVDFTMKNTDHPSSKRVTARGVDESSVAYPPAGNGNGGLAWQLQHTEVSRVIVIYRGAIRISVPGNVPTLQKVGLNPLSFVPTVWELVPWSFLIDYFTNVGDIVTSVSNLGVSLSWKNKTIIRESVADYHLTADASLWKNDTFHQSFTFSAPSAILTRKTVNRASYTGSFIPGLVLELPGSGSKKWLNIAALAVSQAIDGKFRW